ncbi:antiviral helicase [Piedraia hortae CBS 480.64]|uniref:Antiviral helicase n=1 Tax=Piedraia hortae CBS 480.64 TaxID=1314780 RepID=A0A6A7C8C9_9PEZI|nr:antiviral helicase [Piedraia hortae CBS 480.64]
MEEVESCMQELSLQSNHLDNDNDFLDKTRPRKRAKTSRQEKKAKLESDFLTPSVIFSPEWLDRLQQRWQFPLLADYSELCALAPTQSRTIIRFNRKGLEGRVIGYREVTVPANSATAKNSTSLLRKPSSRADFVRGAPGSFPFAPGGLEAVEAAAAYEEELFAQPGQDGPRGSKLDRVIDFAAPDGLLEIPPGFSRGLQWTKPEDESAKEVEAVLQEQSDVPDLVQEEPEPTAESKEESDGEEIDDLLPIEFPALIPRAPLSMAKNKHGGREWAHMVDVNRNFDEFYELVPEMARKWPFEPDTFQKEAIYHLENGDSVFVAAHTSAGKTVVAEYAIALAAKHMTKAIYTSPIKALSNQKFRDFRNTFDDVGILTGDVQIRPEASCLIMTTEILRSMLYHGADLIRDVEFVIFDEVHYVNDTERGVVWEEVIIMLPEHVTLILLSATVPNTYEFASWVGRTKKKDIYVISTPKRPVPLEHYLWAGKKMFKIVDASKSFLENGWKLANEAFTGRDKQIEAEKKAKEKEEGAVAAGRGNRGGRARGGQNRGGQARGGGPARGGPQRGGTIQVGRGHGNIARTGRGGGRTTAAQDRNIWVHLVQHLRKEDLLPCCIFVFSKKRTEENANALSNLDFCTATEKSAIHMILEKSLARLKEDDRELPQIRRVRELLSRGIAVHHGGLLPIVKECVEILFAKTLVKVLFATETFAMGLNLPTRTVVFSGFRKYDTKQFRDLTPGEYTQMAGRAGRRGLDKVGHVIIVAPGADAAPPVARLRQMMLGTPTKLRSQFRLTYNMILNLLRVEALKIEEMIKHSFSEHATQALRPEHEQQIKLSEADLAKVQREECGICDPDIEKVHRAGIHYSAYMQQVHQAMLKTPVGRRLFQPKRLVVIKREGQARAAGILLREGATRGSPENASVQILEIRHKESRRDDTDTLPYIPFLRHHFQPLPQSMEEVKFKLSSVRVSEIEVLTCTSIPIDVQGVHLTNSDARTEAVSKWLACGASSWVWSGWDGLDYRRYLKNLSIRQMLDEQAQAAETIGERRCINCPRFVKHYAMEHDVWLIREHIESIRQLMSDENLQLLPDYEQRVRVLQELGFVDAQSRVELKGKVACEIHSADELVLTELVLENVLAEYEPEEIVALLSAFVFQERTDSTPQLTPALKKGRDTIIALSERVNERQIYHQVILSADDSNDFASKPRFGLVEVVYEWARGMPFSRIAELTDVPEGSIVRVMSRLEETCREVRNAARIIGDPSLFAKMQKCHELIKRDICATASLYM